VLVICAIDRDAAIDVSDACTLAGRSSAECSHSQWTAVLIKAQALKVSDHGMMIDGIDVAARSTTHNI